MFNCRITIVDKCHLLNKYTMKKEESEDLFNNVYYKKKTMHNYVPLVSFPSVNRRISVIVRDSPRQKIEDCKTFEPIKRKDRPGGIS